ncbi:hypothetical protein D3C80_2144430 [compost metagenome]
MTVLCSQLFYNFPVELDTQFLVFELLDGTVNSDLVELVLASQITSFLWIWALLDEHFDESLWGVVVHS